MKEPGRPSSDREGSEGVSYQGSNEEGSSRVKESSLEIQEDRIFGSIESATIGGNEEGEKTCRDVEMMQTTLEIHMEVESDLKVWIGQVCELRAELNELREHMSTTLGMHPSS